MGGGGGGGLVVYYLFITFVHEQLSSIHECMIDEYVTGNH